jgi:4-amino-4-deoxy-L-arabinose transferase-like glycosyltransferase
MPGRRLGPRWMAAIVVISAMTLAIGLGGAGRLTYHEAIWAQSARELIARGDVLVPTLDGRPWLEKPPLATWLIALTSRLAGGVDEAAARVPSAVAAALLALGVATLAARRFGPRVGGLAGCVQATAAWSVLRGRLAEVDILLACLVTWAVVAFDRVRRGGPGWRPWRLAFFALLGATALAKGVGFGGALVVATAATALAWDRDRATVRALAWPIGWGLAAVVALAWPALVLARHPEALGLWATHVADRLAAHPEHFIGEPWWEYIPSPFWQALPWTPLALAGAWRSLGRARSRRCGGDRLLWAWAVAPAALVSLARVRNGHYLIYALPPWSVWSALALARLGRRLRSRGWAPARVRRLAAVVVAAPAVAWAVGFGVLGPRFDGRGAEWAFYQAVGRRLDRDEPLALLYDDWDGHLYPSPFGPMPHDLAVRLFYLDRPACWRRDAADLARRPPAPHPSPFAVIARARDLPALRRLGRVEAVARGPSTGRRHREFALFRIRPGEGFTAEARRRADGEGQISDLKFETSDHLSSVPSVSPW